MKEPQEKAKSDEKLSFALMRLATRLHKMAYLLMLNRAERDGDIKAQDVIRERAKISLEPSAPMEENLPEDFCALEHLSLALEKQLSHLLQEELGSQQRKNMPHQQLKQIEEAFGVIKTAGQA